MNECMNVNAVNHIDGLTDEWLGESGTACVRWFDQEKKHTNEPS